MTKHTAKHLTLKLSDKMLNDVDLLRRSYSRYEYLQRLVEDEIQLQMKIAYKKGLLS